MGYRRLPRALWVAAFFALLSACAGLPESPVLRPMDASVATATAARLDALLPADVLLLGEQHDAAEHQLLAQQTIALLASRGQLAAVALEMAEAGASTAPLKPSATEQQVQSALRWKNQAWPWQAYGPAVMTAVRAGVPVMGANLPGTKMQSSMADGQLDGQLSGPALKAQQQLIRIGHCNLLPESQITPMTRIQIARDISMAHTVSQAAVPGKVVVMLSGSGHVDRFLGVPQHLPAKLSVKTVRLSAGAHTGSDRVGSFDSTWVTPALPEVDHCATLREQFAPKSRPGADTKP